MTERHASTLTTSPAANPVGLPRLLATAGRPHLADHLARWGPLPQGGPFLIDEIGRSGLLGRGGASFPTARKWAAVTPGKAVVVVGNGTEGEPASAKDQTLLRHAPHLVLDGLALAIETFGAADAVICLDRAHPELCQSVSRALAERSRADVDPIPIQLEAVPPGYVSGEESALVNWLNGRPAQPTFGFRPFAKGVGGRPTLVNNVETLAHVALIARFGADWFRSLGTPASPGTALVTLSGDVARAGVFEISLGTSLRDIIAAPGPIGRPQAVLIGGYCGTWLPASVVDTAIAEGPFLRQIEATLGCGAIIVVGPESCGLKATAAIARWMAEQSAGQCGPCRNGLPAISRTLDRLAAGDHAAHLKPQLERWLWMVDGRGACKHPDGVVRLVRSATAVFADEIERHLVAGPCGRPGPVLPLPQHQARW